MTKEEKINRLNHLLSVQILLESMLYSIIVDNYEETRSINPTIANITKNDIYTLHRNHEHYIKKFRPLLNNRLLEDYEELRNIINKFIEYKLPDDGNNK